MFRPFCLAIALLAQSLLMAQFGTARTLFSSESAGINEVFVTDLDGDGLRDLIVREGWWLFGRSNAGNAAFATRHTYLGEVNTFIIHLADVNGDGFDDLLNYNEDSDLLLYLYDPLVGFTDPVQIDDPFDLHYVNCADIDLDGDQDLLYCAGGTVDYRLNDGTGTFGPAVQIANWVNWRFQVADMDGDADLDLVWLWNGGVRWSANNGSLSFAPMDGNTLGALDNTCSDGWLLCEDLDNDGDRDIALGCDDQRAIVKNLGGGNFAPIENEIGLANCMRAQAVDLDGDLDLDLSCYGDGPTLYWCENDGTGAFPSTHPFALVPVSSSFDESRSVATDLDGDGDADIVSNRFVFLNDGTGHFTRHTFGTPDFEMLFASDHDGDGDQELYTREDGPLVQATNTGGLEFFPFAYDTAVYMAGPLFDVVDLNTDGQDDLLYGGPALFWRAGTQGGPFLNEQLIDQPYFVEDARVADLDNNGTPDLDIDDYDAPHQFLLNQGGGVFGPGVNTNLLYIAAAPKMDINGDGFLDLWYYSGVDAKVYLFDGVANLTLGPVFPFCRGWFGDMDGDGDADFVVHDFSTNALGWYANVNGTGVAGTYTPIDPFTPLDPYLFVDLESDGDLDVVFVENSTSSSAVVARYNNGAGVFGPLSTLFSGAYSAVTKVIFSDLDGDTDLELLFAGQAVTDYPGVPPKELVLLENLSPVSVPETTTSPIARLWPNPFCDQLRLRPAPGVRIDRIEIADIHGRILRTMAVQTRGDMMIPRDGLPPGMYLIRLLDGGVVRGSLRAVAE